MIPKEDIIIQNFVKHDRYQATDKKSSLKLSEKKINTKHLGYYNTSIKTNERIYI